MLFILFEYELLQYFIYGRDEGFRCKMLTVLLNLSNLSKKPENPFLCYLSGNRFIQYPFRGTG